MKSLPTRPVAGQQFDYAFDDIGNRKQTKSGGDQSGANLRPANYTNNLLNQITSRDVPGYVDILGAGIATNSVTVNGQTAYRKGEYFRKELSADNTSAALWTNIIVAAAGQTSVTGNVFVAKTPETFGYDADGNLTNDGRWTLTWDAENRLTKVESLATGPTASKRKVVWEFDGKGRRIRQATSDGSSGSYVVTEDLKFVSDGWRHIAELNATNNALVRSYVWGLDLSGSLDGAGGVGGLLMANSAANGVHFYAYDGNGNVAALVKASDGTVSANYEYEAFGQTIRATGTMAKENPFRFSTKRTDNTTDFVLYEMRIYIPSLARWGSRDPIGERGGANIYGFVRNDSCNHWDVDGRFSYSIHHFITFWAAYEAGYSDKCAKKIARAAANTDIWHAFDHPYHFTRPVWGDPETYRQQAERNRDDLRNEAEQHALNGQCHRALKDLGRSLHVQEDYYSHVIDGKPAAWDPSGNYERDGVVDHPNHRDNVDDHDYARAEVARQAVMGTLSSLLRSFSCCCSK